MDGAQAHSHTHSYKTQRDNLKTDLLGNWDGWLSVTHTHTNASGLRHSRAHKRLELRCHASTVQMKTFPTAGNLWWLYDSSAAHLHSWERGDKREERLTNINKEVQRHGEPKKDQFVSLKQRRQPLWDIQMCLYCFHRSDSLLHHFCDMMLDLITSQTVGESTKYCHFP